MSTSPNQPGKSKLKLSLEQQLDELLVQIEEVEPGTLEPEMLPASYRTEREQQDKAPPKPATAAPIMADPADQSPVETTSEQADMLAALNLALQGLGKSPAAEKPKADMEPASDPTPSLSMEDKLQAEIAALMNAEPAVAEQQPEQVTGEVAATDTFDQELEGSIQSPASVASASRSAEDQIALEIEGLLNADQTNPAAAVSPEEGIDELDKLLAMEIDADDDLAGDFQSVEQLVAGIKVPDELNTQIDDEHAATARDVAAELDSQPEDLTKAAIEPFGMPDAQQEEDAFAALEKLPTTERKSRDEDEHNQRAAMQMPDWVYWIETARVCLLNTCFVLNWPARRFLSTEWRANLGYLALLNLFFGVGLWIVLILF